MAAVIFQFPKRTNNLKKLKVAKSVDLQFCWDRRLNNPYLNSLYKSEISYVERWYLQVVHHLNFEEAEHPLVNILLNKNDYTLDLLLTSVEKDIKNQLKLLEDPTLVDKYAVAASYNLVRLNRWQKKWECLINYRNLLYRS